MSQLREVDFWPATAFADVAWLEDPDQDAFVRSARSVCELYSEALRGAAIPGTGASLRFICYHEEVREGVLVTVHPELRGGSEGANVALPPGIAALSAAARGRLVLEVVHAAASRLGVDRGWDQDVLRAAREHVLAAGLRYRWTGPVRSSRDRRHTARPVFVLHDDGFGRVVIEVRRRVDDQVVAVSESALAFTTRQGFGRSAKTLRWVDATTVELTPWAGLMGDEEGLLTLDLTNPGPPGTAEPIPSEPEESDAAGIPAVVVQTPDDLGPRIEVIGGSVSSTLPRAYEKTLDELIERIQSEPWQAWWAEAEEVLEVWYDLAGEKSGTTVRHARGRWRAKFHRPASTLRRAPDPSALARQDVEDMLAAVRRRTGMGPHPPL